MNIAERKDLLVRLGAFMLSDDAEWQSARQKAYEENQWFTPEFTEVAIKNIVSNYLQPHQLQLLIDKYRIPATNERPKKIGIVMAGNIPLVGFHDLLCVFLTGHISVIKTSSKDRPMMEHLVKKMISWAPQAGELLQLQEMLKGCDAYITTGSNNSSRYFEYYFGKYPHIIRRNRTSVAVLTGEETEEELEKLADDVHLYFGLGCRNVTKIFVPEGYDFIPLLTAFRKYNYLADHNKYKNNYDYNLAMHIMNKKQFMSTEGILLVEDASVFSPIAQLHYQHYSSREELNKKLKDQSDLQCIVSGNDTGFGQAQTPDICSFADGVDTIEFLLQLDAAEVRRP